jgi:hypothetical protein
MQLRLLIEPDRHRVAIEFSVARLDGGDDDEDGVQDPEDGEEKAAPAYGAACCSYFILSKVFWATVIRRGRCERIGAEARFSKQWLNASDLPLL